ncbi:uncharacterized protein CBL_04095 [Carabus blaptoides fortunei]
MSRYFQNSLPDYINGDIKLSEDDLKTSVSQIISQILEKCTPNEKNAENGLYLGSAGIAYMFYHLSKNPALKNHQQEYLNNAMQYIQPALLVATKLENKTRDLPSFLLGNSGIYAVAAAIFQATKDVKLMQQYREKYVRIAPICKKSFLECGADELFVGRAGYLCGALWMAKETDTPLALSDLYDICNCIVTSGRAYSKQNNCTSPLMYQYYTTEYFGAAHGLCSILQMLMCVPGYLDAYPGETKDIKASVDYLLALQTEHGNFPCASDEINVTARSEEHELVHWCHGAPGTVYLMARAYIVFGDEKYLQSCEKCAELVWIKGLLRKGPGICHGVAGNGYVFLLLYRLTNDLKYIHRAMAFAQFLDADEFKTQARTPDYPYSLYEGIAGTACYLADIMQPNEAVFPFSDIF